MSLNLPVRGIGSVNWKHGSRALNEIRTDCQSSVGQNTRHVHERVPSFKPSMKEKRRARKFMERNEVPVERCRHQDTIVEEKEGLVDESCLLLYGSSSSFSVALNHDKTPSVPARRKSMPEIAASCDKVPMVPVRSTSLVSR
jgi:hypothetical protein